MFRGPFDDREWTSYHPEGKRIFTAFVNGLNAYITQLGQDRTKLPVEFKLTGIAPSLWTPETVLLRAATLGDAGTELQLARLVARVGEGDVFLEQPVRQTSTLLAIRHAYELIPEPCPTCPRLDHALRNRNLHYEI
jgi:acyl-homoserine lactone acylase PvdQ